MIPDPAQTQLIVFSDDWARHPSSCQHLVTGLLPDYQTLWVNTIGTRFPRLSREDLYKVTVKLRQWIVGPQTQPPKPDLPGLTVINPPMWPGFSKPWQRRLNAKLIRRTVHAALGPRSRNQNRIAVTTIPVTADLIGQLDVDRWVYYCPDDFAAWPGLDAHVMQQMEAKLVPRVDACIAASETLQHKLTALGSNPSLLTHGVDLAHWSPPGIPPPPEAPPEAPPEEASAKPDTTPLGKPNRGFPPSWPPVTRPIILFWGLIDQRLDLDWCKALAQSLQPTGTFILVGPTQTPDPALTSLDQVMMPGPVSYEQLPSIAATADVLVMPYADLPVTRAMQPLKFKEYLATGKPVVTRNLPATISWADSADVVDTKTSFIERVHQRIDSGVPAQQVIARQRLECESWDHKAMQLDAVLRQMDKGF